MKKKSVRKVSSAKKVISKSALKKKKSFSLRSWLLGGLVLLVASAYGLYQYNLQPKGIKVLQIPGTVLDYLEPEAVSINAVKNCGQDPECADMVDAARRAGATTSLQQQSQTSIRVAKEIEQSLESKPIKESKNEEVIEARQEAVKTAESIVTKVETQINTYLNEAKIADQIVVGNGTGCATQHFTVAEGETMVGLVANSQTDPNAGENTGSNMIVKCSGGNWIPTGCYEKNGVVTGPDSCKLTVKPIYAGGKNCYNDGGASVLGDGSISENGDGTASRCDGGTMIEGLTKVDGLWMTESEKTKYEFDREVKKKADQAAANKAREWECVNAGDDGKVGKWNGNGCVVDSRADTCAAKGSGYEWNSSSETCVSKKAPTTTETCRPQGTLAFCQTTDGQGNVVSSRQANTTEECLPQGTQLKCRVYTTNAKGEKVALRDYIKTGTLAKVNPSGIYQNGEKTSKESDCIYGGDPIEGSGSSQGIFYNCRNSSGTVPRTLVTTNFGNNNNQPTIPVGAREVTSIRECNTETEVAGTAGTGLSTIYYCDDKATPPQTVIKESEKPPSFFDFYFSYSSEEKCNDNLPNNKECVPGSLPGMFERVKKVNTQAGTISTNLDPGDCNHNRIQGTSCYKIPGSDLRELASSTGRSAGQTCNSDNSCASNDCNLEKRPGTNKYDWYCMSEKNTYQNLDPIGKGTYYAKPNGDRCWGDNNQCISGFCRNNLFFDTCADNPFANSAPVTTTVIE